MKNKKKINLIFLLIILCSIDILCISIIGFRMMQKKLVEKQVEIMNQISLETVHANLTVYTTGYIIHPFIGSQTVTMQGSGAIFQEDEKYYYLLTNNHVVYLDTSYHEKEYKVVDYLGNTYEATLIKNDADYDLAILKIEKGKQLLKVLPFASEDPKIGQIVISIGQPDGQRNTVTMGKILNYTRVAIKNENDVVSDVSFPVIQHNAPGHQGSSGGVLLNEKLQIIGINYAGKDEENQVSLTTFAVPLEKIKEFLEK